MSAMTVAAAEYCRRGVQATGRAGDHETTAGGGCEGVHLHHGENCQRHGQFFLCLLRATVVGVLCYVGHRRVVLHVISVCVCGQLMPSLVCVRHITVAVAVCLPSHQ